MGMVWVTIMMITTTNVLFIIEQQEGETLIDTDGRTVYDHSNLAELGSSNPVTQRMVELAKKAEQKSKEVRCG